MDGQATRAARRSWSSVRGAWRRKVGWILLPIGARGLPSGEEGGRYRRRAPAAARAARTPRIWCGARWSGIATSPGRQGGANPCGSQAKNLSPSRGPSKSPGAQGPSRRRPAIRVGVAYRPWGMRACRRAPPRARPRRRVLWGWAPLSSTKTRGAIAGAARCSCPCALLSATSGRSGSAATRVFFKFPAAPPPPEIERGGTEGTIQRRAPRGPGSVGWLA